MRLRKYRAPCVDTRCILLAKSALTGKDAPLQRLKTCCMVMLSGYGNALKLLLRSWCTSLQCKNPKRDLPVGIVGSLVVTTLLYVATALVRHSTAHVHTSPADCLQVLSLAQPSVQEERDQRH
jgi:hypothetical protein